MLEEVQEAERESERIIKVKKLEELGISPAPWKCTTYIVGKAKLGEIRTLDGFKIGVDLKKPDALIEAAAPDLYDAGQKTEAVLTGLFKLDEFAALLKSGAADALIACRDEMRKALVKASGEEDESK